MARYICDGHEYRARELPGGSITLINNYGTHVATATKSPCGEYWCFESIEDGAPSDFSDTYHDQSLAGYPIGAHLTRWYAAVAA